MKSTIKTAFFVKAIFLASVFFIMAGDSYGQLPITNPAPGQLIISEFRSHGPNGANDEFVEIYNTTNSTIKVVDQSSDLLGYRAFCPAGAVGGVRCGWAIVNLSNSTGGSPTFVIPENTEIPPHGHYLIANNGTSGYSLTGYAAANGTYNTTDIPDGFGIALFKTANTAAYSGSNICFNGSGGTTSPCVLDAVGFGNNAEPYREGTGLAPVSTPGEYSFVRRSTGGIPQDTGNNANDFIFVSTDGAVYDGVSSTLGAPGPENLTSPVLRGNDGNLSRVNDTVNASTSPNRMRDTNSYTDTLTPSAPNGGAPASNPYTLGTLSLRRRFTNTSSVTLTSLRMRVDSLTTLEGGASPPVGTADVRVITSPTLNGIPVTAPGTGTVLGMTLQEPPNQPSGGGINSSLSIPLNGGLAPGQTVDIHILLGVVQGGTYRILVSFEGLP